MAIFGGKYPKKYSESYAGKVVSRLLSQYINIDRKKFYRNARKLGLTKSEQAQYLMLLKEQFEQTQKREEIIRDLLKSTAKKQDREIYGNIKEESLERILRQAEMYRVEWLPSTPSGLDEYSPIKDYEVKTLTKSELFSKVLSNISEEGWKSKIEEYKRRYLEALKYSIDEDERYKILKARIENMSWQEYLLFSLTREGRIGYIYEKTYQREAFENLGIEQEETDALYYTITEGIESL